VDDPRLLEAGAQQACLRLIASLADNKYVLGRRYAEWCTGAPMLESAIAAAAMAQAELGHARWLYPLLRTFPGAGSPGGEDDAGWAARPTRAVKCLDQEFRSWHDFVAANFVLDTAFTVLMEAAAGGRFVPLGQRANKVVLEEATHWAHAEGWVRRLASGADSRAALAAALQGAWPHALAWYGAPEDALTRTLADASVLAADSDALRGRLVDRVRPALEAGGLMGALLEVPVRWEHWDPATRRLEV